MDVPVDGETPFTPYLPAVAAIMTAADATVLEAQKVWFEQVEDLVATCMGEQGFEYVPLEYLPPEGDVSPFSRGDSLYLPRLPEERQDVERFGYGVDPTDPLESLGESTPARDRNLEIYEALSETGKSAYDEALYGYAGDSEESAAEGYEDSCAGRAASRYPSPAEGASEVAILEQYGSLVSGLHQLRTRDTYEDERTIALNEEWDSCMREAGYELAWPEYGFAHPDPFYALDLAIRTPVGGVAGEPQPDTPTDQIPIDERTLVGSDEERIIALADFDCRAATDYQARLLAVLVDLEERFVAAHNHELTELMAAIELMNP